MYIRSLGDLAVAPADVGLKLQAASEPSFAPFAVFLRAVLAVFSNGDVAIGIGVLFRQAMRIGSTYYKPSEQACSAPFGRL